MCDLCTPRHYIREDTRSNTLEDAAAYERHAGERDEIELSRVERLIEADDQEPS